MPLPGSGVARGRPGRQGAAPQGLGQGSTPVRRPESRPPSKTRRCSELQSPARSSESPRHDVDSPEIMCSCFVPDLLENTAGGRTMTGPRAASGIRGKRQRSRLGLTWRAPRLKHNQESWREKELSNLVIIVADISKFEMERSFG